MHHPLRSLYSTITARLAAPFVNSQDVARQATSHPSHVSKGGGVWPLWMDGRAGNNMTARPCV